jgi:hypothetical protein
VPIDFAASATDSAALVRVVVTPLPLLMGGSSSVQCAGGAPAPRM